MRGCEDDLPDEEQLPDLVPIGADGRPTSSFSVAGRRGSRPSLRSPGMMGGGGRGSLGGAARFGGGAAFRMEVLGGRENRDLLVLLLRYMIAQRVG